MKSIKPRNQSLILALILTVAVLIGFGAMYGLAAKNTPNRRQAVCKDKDICVSLLADKASPETLTISVGSYVQFNSADGKSHNLSVGKGGEDHDHGGKFSSGEFKADEGWRVQFNEEGTYFFHDHLNPKINILVVVYTPGKDYKL